MKLTRALRKISKLKNRLKVVQGSTSAGKTYAILQIWIINALEQNPKFIGMNSIVSESMPHLRRGAEKDFFDILLGEGLYIRENHNKSNHTYKIGECVFEFFSADQDDKLRGARRKNLFLNEANNIKEAAYDQLEIRTEHNIWIDFNPVADFWGLHQGEEPLIVTYKDNQYLSDNIVKAIESRRDNEQWWRVYGLGLLGTVEGVIITNWEPINGVPEEAELLGHGLDFGFSNDPTAVVSLYRYNGEIIVDELLFEKGLTNKEIADKLKPISGALYCDSAEPKSIKELNNESVRALPAKKGKDSVKFGLQLLQDYRIRPTSSSLNLITALRNYSWAKDRNGDYINTPNHAFSDIVDALRYGAVMLLTTKGQYSSPKRTNNIKKKQLDIW